MNIPSACKIANIDQNDAMILPHDANLRRMTFSERTARWVALYETVDHPCILICLTIKLNLRTRIRLKPVSVGHDNFR
jgi:hypothetical protein